MAAKYMSMNDKFNIYKNILFNETSKTSETSETSDRPKERETVEEPECEHKNVEYTPNDCEHYNCGYPCRRFPNYTCNDCGEGVFKIYSKK